MAGGSWTRAVCLVPQVLAETHADRVFEWFLPIAFCSVHSFHSETTLTTVKSDQARPIR
jgi:hypothetical protein